MGAFGGPRAGRRDCLGIGYVPAGDGTFGRVANGIADVAGAAVASCRSNARHKAERFPGLSALAAGLGVSVPAFAPGRAVEKATPGRVPTDEWVRRALRRAARGDPGSAPASEATRQLRELDASCALPGRGGACPSRTCQAGAAARCRTRW